VGEGGKTGEGRMGEREEGRGKGDGREERKKGEG
jgi:hypothetical protein